MSDRIGVMNDGVFEQVGTPEEIFNSPANEFVGSFIGEPAMNVVEGVVRDGAIRLDDDDRMRPLSEDRREVEEVSSRVSDGRVRVGFRPTHVTITDGADECLMESSYMLAEPNGENYIVYLDHDRGQVIAISETKPEYTAGEAIGIEHLEKYYVFDPDSRETLVQGPVTDDVARNRNSNPR